MPRRRSPARLIIALSVAGVLAIFLVYFAVVGGGTPDIQPSELRNRSGEVVLTGKVVPNTVQEREGGVHFQLRDIEGEGVVPVVYRDNPPDMFRGGRDLSLRGELRSGIFVGEPGTMITKCPSKYTPARSGEQAS